MKELTTKTEEAKIQTISSRDVAKMMEKRHDHLLRDIEKHTAILEKVSEPNFGVADLWILSSYLDAQGKERKEYQVTKKGCEFLAHKTTGEKGDIFTIRYMNRFEEMEKQLQQLLLEQLQQDVKVLTNYKIKGDTINDVCSATGLRRKTIKEYLFDHDWVEEYNGEISTYDGRYIYIMRRKDVHFTKKGLDKILKDLQPRKPKRVFFNKELYRK